MPAPPESAILRPMPRHERPEIPEGYAAGRAARRAILRALLAREQGQKGPTGTLRLSRATGLNRQTTYDHAERLRETGHIEQTGRGYVLTYCGRESAYLLSDLDEPLTASD